MAAVAADPTIRRLLRAAEIPLTQEQAVDQLVAMSIAGLTPA